MDDKKEILGLIPARGGSKSIPKKNIISLAGHPMLAYVANAAKKCRTVNRILCSTDDPEIADAARACCVEITDRPLRLARDDTHIIDVILDLLSTLKKGEGYEPFAVALLQPTSPFLLPEHIDQCCKLLLKNPDAASAQTIASFPHNFHAYNQRIVENGIVRFRFERERAVCYNKQTKPKFYVFGNFVVTRTSALLETGQVFARPSAAFEIPYTYALDVDGPEDLEFAEFYIEKQKILLPGFRVE
ncbi:MAG: acylneuraminate cytidylyltransferase family protein [Desulfobulbaceae bacterium]|nr:acylneuraminate cytidylyltransferase family protein [Desulfobulbaceae bacterium]